MPGAWLGGELNFDAYQTLSFPFVIALFNVPVCILSAVRQSILVTAWLLNHADLRTR
jgi:hypothetical protein